MERHSSQRGKVFISLERCPHCLTITRTERQVANLVLFVDSTDPNQVLLTGGTNYCRCQSRGGWRYRQRLLSKTQSAYFAVVSRILRTFPQRPIASRHDHSSSKDTSRYLLEPHSLSATYFRRAVTSMRADFPSGNAPTTFVLLLISLLSRSMALFVLMRRQCSSGNLVYASVW